MQPLDAAARKAGVQFLLEHRMTALHRENATLGPRDRHRRDHKGATRQHPRAQGGDRRAPADTTGNVNFRRMFDPRLTEEYCGLAGMPWSDQDASGEIAGMAVGASLWGLSNQTAEFGSAPHQGRARSAANTAT